MLLLIENKTMILNKRLKIIHLKGLQGKYSLKIVTKFITRSLLMLQLHGNLITCDGMTQMSLSAH
jgi:hypothetical protein